MENRHHWRQKTHLYREALLVFIFTLIIFTAGLGNHEFINFDTRFALFAQEMIRNGLSFFPTAFGQPYPDYPATSTILIYLCSLPWGHVTKFSGVLPSAIATSLTLSFMYLTAAPLSRRWGVCAVLFALFTVGYIATARSIALDQYTTLVTMLSFYFAYSAHLHHKKTLWWCFPVLFLFGLACRGPIGIVIPASVVGSYYLMQKDWRSIMMIAGIALVTLIIGMSLLLWAAYAQGGAGFMHEVLSMQLFNRLADSKAGDPFYYYFVNSFGTYAIAYPIAIFTCIGLLPKIIKLELDHPLKLIQLLAVWTLVIIIGMSIPHDKKPRYILAIVPAISLISAYLFVEKFPSLWIKLTRKTLAWLCFIFPIVGAILTQIAKSELEQRGIHLSIDFTSVIIMLCALQALAVVLCLFYRSSRSRELIALAIATMVFVAINIVIVEPTLLNLTQSRRFVRQVDMLRDRYPGDLIFYRADKDALIMRYVVNSREDLKPIKDIKTESELANLKPPVYVIMEQEEFEQLAPKVANQFRVIIQGQIGRDTAVALEK